MSPSPPPPRPCSCSCRSTTSLPNPPTHHTHSRSQSQTLSLANHPFFRPFSSYNLQSTLEGLDLGIVSHPPGLNDTMGQTHPRGMTPPAPAPAPPPPARRESNPLTSLNSHPYPTPTPSSVPSPRTGPPFTPLKDPFARTPTPKQHIPPVPPLIIGGVAMQPEATDQTWSRIEYSPAPRPPVGSKTKRSAAQRAQPEPPSRSLNSFGLPLASRPRGGGLVRKFSQKAKIRGGGAGVDVGGTCTAPEPITLHKPNAKALKTLGEPELGESNHGHGRKGGLGGDSSSGSGSGESSKGESRTIKAGTFASASSRPRVKPSALSLPRAVQVGSGLVVPQPLTPTPTPTPTAQLLRSAPGLAIGIHRRVVPSPTASIRSSPSRRAEKEWRARVAAISTKGQAGVGVPYLGSQSSSIVELRGPVPPRRIARVTATAAAAAGGERERERRGGESSEEGDGDTRLVTPPHSDAQSQSQSYEDARVRLRVRRNDSGVDVHQAQGGAHDDTPAKSFMSNKSFETLGHYPNQQQQSQSQIQGERKRNSSIPYSISSFYFNADGSPSCPSSYAAGTLLSPTIQRVHGYTRPPSVAAQQQQQQQYKPLPVPKTPTSLEQRFKPVSTPSPHPTPSRGTALSIPSRGTELSTPSTPYSPTTAYILTADPDLNLDLDASPGGHPQVTVHPYAAPTKGQGCRSPLRHTHTHNYSQSSEQRRTGFKSAIVGNPSAPGLKGANRGIRIDLTPGMESGMRPPKSGLPLRDLERWLGNVRIDEDDQGYIAD